ncbi:Stk1 family PASTA domain-containing Ser/Thr kinase [Clostridium pasteurianum]|uniref:non-specific serine/threonine protein kinase n=1 Tax=Clostridium pasteurianum BC1 TaxID=86416 RepID=R4K409_CLOPA|nr:Stk1 family PASTA domain-containing Ser/Thr kinase [Clostridium pasteurianum]AGK97318.1 serine/threonine protein kinase [Clostridium pasteurianum BC1]
MLVGTTLNNRYELLEKIGEGGTAVVYKAKCHLLNRFVAVKVLKDELASDKEFVEKFKREASSAASLSSNNIVNTYDVGTENNINYIVLEYIKGKTLKQIITEEGNLSWKKAVNISRQIASALDCAHKNNIVHRDIKPHNILVTEDGIVKVADFGIAKASDSVTITNSNKIMGSAHYLSPEQAKGIVVDGRTDIYSLGIVIYEMLTGKVPYDAESPVSVALKHIQDPVIPPQNINANIPNNLNNLVLKCMEKNPVSRYQNAKELIEDLDKLNNNSNFDNQTLKDDYTRVMDPIKDTAQFTPLGNTNNLSKENLQDEIKKNSYTPEENKENEEEKQDKEIPHKRVSPVLKNKKSLIMATIIAIVAIIVVVVGLKLGESAASVTAKSGKVPNIIGMMQDKAKTLVESEGFKFTIAGTEKNDKPKGTVIASYPNVGDAVNKGDSIRVTISSGPDQSVVPDVGGLDLEKAKEVIQNAGCTVGDVSKDYSDSPVNTVTSINPIAGTTVDKGSAISMVISMGPRIKQSVVPSVKGKSQDEAVAALSNKNLLANVIPRETQDSNQNNIVADQDIPAGTKLNQGSKVTIAVYKYTPPAAVMPSVKGVSQDVAIANLNSENIASNVSYKITQDKNQNNVVAEQDIQPGTKLNPGDKVNLTVYQYTAPKDTNSTGDNNTVNNTVTNNSTANNPTANNPDENKKVKK